MPLGNCSSRAMAPISSRRLASGGRFLAGVARSLQSGVNGTKLSTTIEFRNQIGEVQESRGEVLTTTETDVATSYGWRRTTILALAAVLAISCGAAFAWSVSWNWDIGVQASNSGGSGANDAAWIWLFVTFVAACGSIGLFLFAFALLGRRRVTARDAHQIAGSGGSNHLVG
jgi:hypothetical protein